jgi:membrane protease YdiL (CAAX protease family)
MAVIVIALVVGLPLAIVGLASLGLAGWIVAAAVLPVAALATLLWLGHERAGRQPPGTRDDR